MAKKVAERVASPVEIETRQPTKPVVIVTNIERCIAYEIQKELQDTAEVIIVDPNEAWNLIEDQHTRPKLVICGWCDYFWWDRIVSRAYTRGLRGQYIQSVSDSQSDTAKVARQDLGYLYIETPSVLNPRKNTYGLLNDNKRKFADWFIKLKQLLKDDNPNNQAR